VKVFSASGKANTFITFRSTAGFGTTPPLRIPEREAIVPGRSSRRDLILSGC